MADEDKLPEDVKSLLARAAALSGDNDDSSLASGGTPEEMAAMEQLRKERMKKRDERERRGTPLPVFLGSCDFLRLADERKARMKEMEDEERAAEEKRRLRAYSDRRFHYD